MMGIVVRVKAALRSIAFLDSSSSNFFTPPMLNMNVTMCNLNCND